MHLKWVFTIKTVPIPEEEKFITFLEVIHNSICYNLISNFVTFLFKPNMGKNILPKKSFLQSWNLEHNLYKWIKFLCKLHNSGQNQRYFEKSFQVLPGGTILPTLTVGAE